jgi:hypothetical protein
MARLKNIKIISGGQTGADGASLDWATFTDFIASIGFPSAVNSLDLNNDRLLFNLQALHGRGFPASLDFPCFAFA